MDAFCCLFFLISLSDIYTANNVLLLSQMVPSDFFPAGVKHYFTSEQHGTDVLSVEEQRLSAKYGAKRLTDFCTGRYCLRFCTSALGYSGEILVGERGMPLLPAGITASVSHSKVLCGAVAATTTNFLSIGMDVETVGRVHADMWHLLFTPAEIAYLKAIPSEMEREIVSTSFFSLKEAFYKMQFPLTATYLDLHDAEVTLSPAGYRLRLLENAGNYKSGALFPGNVHYNGNEVVTFCVLPVL